MDYWNMLYNYNLILWAIVGTAYAAKVLRGWSIQFFNRDPAKAASKAAEKVRKAQEKTAAKLKKLQSKMGNVVDDAREAVADALEDTADEVRPE